MKITIEIYIRKEGIGSNTLVGKLFQDLFDNEIDIAPIQKIRNKKVIFIYEGTNYSSYPRGGDNNTPITGRQLADENIKQLKEWKWEVEERNA